MIVAALLLLAGCGAMPAQPDAEYDPWEPCGHEVKPIISAELVGQEKPLVFFQLMEEPKIEGIKVRLTYEDNSSEVVDAYDIEMCRWYIDPGFDAGMHHLKGMCINTQPIWPAERPALKPGKHQLAMFCVDGKYWWNTDESNSPRFDSLSPEDVSVAYCMVEVYAQTGDEYIAEHNMPFALVTESNGGEVTKQWVSSDGIMSYGLVKLLVEESGTYAIEVENGSIHEYNGFGGFKFVTRQGRFDFYAKLNANEPMFLKVVLSHGNPAHVTMKRVPDGEVSWEE